MKHEETVGESYPATEHAILHPDEAPQLVPPRAEWNTIFQFGVTVGYDDWLAWHFAIILSLRYP
jgi:hypothetical protein